MYRTHWGLTETPFRARLDPRYFYHGEAQEEALARLAFLVDERRRVGLVMGQRGSGKSFLLAVFAQQMRQLGRPVVLLNLLGLDQASLLWQLALALGLEPQPEDRPAALWQRITDRIAENRYQQSSTIMLLDDADRAKPDAITLVTRLAQHDPSPDATLTLVLAGRQEQMSRLGRTLVELAELRIDLESWDLSDTQAHIKTALEKAGCAKAVFDASAIARLHELTGGIPRLVNHLADLALLAGAAQKLPQITSETIDLVYEELAVVAA